jgi:ribonuclease BN (tRNA processing enzyme)
MEFITIGTGNAFTKKNWQSNFLIRQNNKCLLIDCGTYAWLPLNDEHGITTADIDAVYISHEHADHIGGLEELALTTYFNPTVNRPKLFCQGQYEKDTDTGLLYTSGLVKELWDHNLSGGLHCLEGKEATLCTYFDVCAVESNGGFTWEGIKFDIVQTIHVASKYKIEHSYGLMWNDPDTGERIYLTTDTQFCPVNAMKAYLKEADIVFHDCETSPYPSGVHAHYTELVTLSPEIKSKMWLYHYHDNVIDNWDEMNQKAINDGFLGFIPTSTLFVRQYNAYDIGTVGKKG